MKNWLKKNWFQAGVLFVLLVGVLSISYYYVVFLPRKESQPTPITQTIAVATTTPPVATATYPVVANQSENQVTENPTLKIATCQSDAEIESEKDISRYNVATVQDFTACAVNSQCNATNLESIFKTVAENIGHSTYENMYNLCLQVSQTAFDNVIQTYDGYWTQCTASNPTPNDADTSETEGVNVYSARQDCVNNLEKN